MTTTVSFARSADWAGGESDIEAVLPVVAAMTLEEKIGLVSVAMTAGEDAPADAVGSAAYCPGPLGRGFLRGTRATRAWG